MKNLAEIKPNNVTAAITAVFHLVLFLIGLFLYLTLGESVIVLALIVGVPLFFVSIHFGVLGGTLNIFQKPVLIRVLIWWFTGGVIINVVDAVVYSIG